MKSSEIVYSSIFLHKRAEHRITQKGLVCWQLKKASLLPTQKFPVQIT